MSAGIQPVKPWVHEVYGRIDLGDARLERRLLQVATACVKQPGKSLGQMFGRGRECKGAYRLIENKRLQSQSLFASLENAGGRACAGQKRLLVVHDTTEWDYSHRNAEVKGLGPLHTRQSPGQGLLLHSSLALDEQGTPMGLLSLQSWARDPEEMGKREERHEKPIEEKESYKWLVGLEKTQAGLQAHLPEGSQPEVIHVLDREGDLFEVFEMAYRLEQELVVRAAWDRNVAGEEQHLWEAMQKRPVGGEFTITIPPKPRQAARTARVSIRWGQAILKPPRKRKKGKVPVAIDVVWVLEENPPEGVEAVEWMLLTTLPVPDREGAMEIVRIYRCRWRVEDLHLILKSGCGMEKSQCESRETLEKVLALFLLSALRILLLRYLSETQPECSADRVLDAAEQEALRVYIRSRCGHEFGAKITVAEVRFWIGRIGGHLGRKRDGPPGVRTLWRGWRDFEIIVSMYLALHPQ